MAGWEPCYEEYMTMCDVSKWDKIVKRDSLQAFPCDAELAVPGLMCCYGESGEGDSCSDPACPLRPIFEEYMAMRAVVKAVLYDRTPAHMARAARRSPAAFPDRPEVVKRYGAIADAWDGIA